MFSSEEAGSPARERLRQIFQYLKALHQHRNPPKFHLQQQLWFRRFSDLPEHEVIGIGDRARSDDFVLRVGRPAFRSAPTPPNPLREWLDEGWDSPEKPLVFHPSKETLDQQGERVVTRFNDDPGRVDAKTQWAPLREDWARTEKPARRAMAVFEELFSLWGTIQRESERVELVIGDGILRWSREAGEVHHPILLQRVELEFDPDAPEFRVVETNAPVEFYESAFPPGGDFDARTLKAFKGELEERSLHPLDREDTSTYLNSIVVRLSPRGTFVDDPPPPPKGNDPTIGRDPVLFLRSRSQGFTRAIESVLEAIDRGDEIPTSLAQVVGIESNRDSGESDTGSRDPDDNVEEEADILFSKPANLEQFRIAKRLGSHEAVLVQGPPGTGKSHTIANLIGHLLAQGKSILVTSHTTKALKVLRGHVVESLRPLCVSVLERDIDSRRELEEAVGAIVTRLTSSDRETLLKEAAACRASRERLQDEIEDLEDQLRRALEAEYRPFSVGGTELSPSEAARWLAKERDTSAWIPGPVARGAPLPLSKEDLVSLYRTNELLTEDVERRCRQELPEIQGILTPAAMRNACASLQELSVNSVDVDDTYWGSTSQVLESGDFDAILNQLDKVIEPLNDDSKWRLEVVESGSRPGGRGPWDKLIEKIRTTAGTASRFAETNLRFAPTLPHSLSLEESAAVILELQERMRRKGKLPWGFLQPARWRTLLNESRVQGKPPSRLEHFRALSELAEVHRQRSELRTRWNRQMAPLGGPPGMKLGPEPEEGAEQFIPQIESALAWHRESWSPLVERLREVGFDWDSFLGAQPPVLGQHGALIRLREAASGPLRKALETRKLAVWHKEMRQQLANQTESLQRVHGQVANQLAQAIESSDPGAYEDAYSELALLQQKRVVSEERRDYLKKLRAAAPNWADAIDGRQGVHSAGVLPGDPESAWKWRQVADELEERAALDERALSERIERRSGDLRQVTSELIEHLAWAEQISRTGHRERQALVGWLDTMRRIGKGTGKRVPRLRAEARKLMSEARSAVPVWILPISRAVESFDPLETKFDVVIVDEASQSDVLGLTALFMGSRVLVVGDHEQVSPSAVGQKLDVVENLITTHLDGIPNKHLYDGLYSIYDVARSSFGSAIRLVEHFRCVPEIIDFSNWLSYNGEIKPLRDPSTSTVRPSVVDFFVSEGSVSSKVNEREAEATAALLLAATEQPEYEGKTFGVISLVGDEQAQQVAKKLIDEMKGEYEKRRILCGSAASFQGDERDVVFLSVVDAPNVPLRLRNDTRFRQRFNVAASRAKDQMWVVHSLSPGSDLKADDLRRRLIDYARDPQSRKRATEQAQSRAQSDFEKRVIEQLVAKGYRVRSQVTVGYYRIDIVVYGSAGRVAIECDGDRYHPIEKIPDDMARQATLERLGWRFIRIRGSRFYRDPEETMRTVEEQLQERGIEPLGASDGSVDERRGDVAAAELQERLIRRAYELMRSWHPEETTPTALDGST